MLRCMILFLLVVAIVAASSSGIGSCTVASNGATTTSAASRTTITTITTATSRRSLPFAAIMFPNMNRQKKTYHSIPKIERLAQEISNNNSNNNDNNNNCLLNYKAAFGDKETPFQIQNILVQLSTKKQRQRPKRNDSSGIFQTSFDYWKEMIKEHNKDDKDKQQLLQSYLPYYINEKGLQTIDTMTIDTTTISNDIDSDNDSGSSSGSSGGGGWEIRWPSTSPHGFLICSFVIPTQLQRNANTPPLEPGRFFMYHRFWSKSSLESERKRRKEIQAIAAKSLKERDEHVKTLMSSSSSDDNDNIGNYNNNNNKKENNTNQNNALDKIVSYGKAAKSMNEYRTSGLQEARYVPLYDDQVLKLSFQSTSTTPTSESTSTSTSTSMLTSIFTKDDNANNSLGLPEDCILLSTRGLIYRIGTTVTGRNELEYAGESRVDFYNRK